MSQATAPADVVGALRRRGVQRVDDSVAARAMYAADASLYRVVPQVVVRAQHIDELPVVHEVSHELGVPVTMRGAGTSIAGNAVGPGIGSAGAWWPAIGVESVCAALTKLGVEIAPSTCCIGSAGSTNGEG